MPLKLHVGIQKKRGLPHYSSVSAACSLELELDQSLLVDDPERFRDRVRRTYAACRDAVESELAHQLNRDPDAPEANDASVDGSSGGSHSSSDRRAAENRAASRKQVAYIEKLAGQIPDFDQPQLAALCDRHFGKSPTDLSCHDASRLIDILQDLKDGRLDIDTAFHCAA
jgi:hypothetical protein